MPHKVNLARRHHFEKAKYHQTNYAQYNDALRNRGRIDIWLSDEILANWQNEIRIHDGTGSSEKYPDITIEACHYLRMVFKLPLRQAQGFITNILNIMGYSHLDCPDYSLLSKRLDALGFNTPKFKTQKYISTDDIAIAIDSTGLKVFGKDEWHQEKHKVNAKRTWRKAHFGVTDKHIIQSAILTTKNCMDDSVVGELCEQLPANVTHVSADKMYDTNAVYRTLDSHFPKAEIAIPPKKDTCADDYHHAKRMSNLVAQAALGEIGWQRKMRYGKRNVSENAMQRYKKIIGPKLHSINFKNQTQEMMLGASILNKFTHLGMPNSYRVA